MSDQQQHTRYNLGSSGLVYAPGIISWAQAFYLSDPDHAVGVVADTWGLPRDAAEFLLANPECAEVREDDEVVSFTFPPLAEEV